MSNDYVPDLAQLAPGQQAQSSQVNTRYENTVAGFDKLPAPASGKQGFRDPCPVGAPIENDHAATKEYADNLVSQTATDAQNAQAAQAAAETAQAGAELAEINTQSSETNAAVSAASAASSASAAAASASSIQLTADKSLWPTIANDVLDSDHGIVFGSGKIPDSTGAKILERASSLTKKIDGAWAAGDNQPGMLSGTVVANTAYACFELYKDSDDSVECGFEAAETPTLPAGYTLYRRVGWLITDSDANIVGFKQYGDYFRLNQQILDVDDASPGTDANPLTTSCPPNIIGIIGEYFDHSGSAILLVTSTDEVDRVPTTLDNTIRIIGAEGSMQDEILVYVDANSQIRYRSTVASVVGVRLSTRGWIDQRV